MANKVTFGTNPIAWSNDDKRELGGATPLEVCLSEAALAGYSGIELGHKFPRQADVLRPTLAEHGLSLISGWYSSELLLRSVADEKAALEAHLSLLADMGCKVVVWAETTNCIHGREDVALGARPMIAEGDWNRFCDGLSAMGEHVATRGLTLAYHHHMGTVIETEAEIDRMMAGTSDKVGLLLDTGHLTYAGGSPLAVAKRHASRIAHVHCKDVRAGVLAAAKAGDWSFLKAVTEGVFTVPGDGMVDYPPVMDVLKSVDYEGWLVVEAEQDPAKANPLEYARKGYQALVKYAKDAGLA